MAWQQVIERLRGRSGKKSDKNRRRAMRRRLQHETLNRRMLLAGDLGAISGVSFVDLTGDGLDVSDPRLDGVTINLYRDVDDNGILDANDGAAIDTTTSDNDGFYFFRGLTVDTYLVEQESAGADLVAPDPIVIDVTNAGGSLFETIDDFSATAQSLIADGSDPTDEDSALASEVLGGARDLEVTRTSAQGILFIAADPNDETLSIGSQTQGAGTLLIQYDGNDGSTTLDPTGLGGVSLADGSPGDPVDSDAGLLIQATQENAGDTIDVRIYTDGANYAEATGIVIPELSSGETDVYLRFSTDFTLVGTPDFNDVGAIEFEVSIAANNDKTFEAFNVRGPMIETGNLPNEQLLTLGGTVFNDNGTNANNGVLDGAEIGVAGVTVELYAEPDGGGAIDPDTQTPVATTATDSNGDYSFDTLLAGNYLVVVPESEFGSSAVLEGMTSSTGNDPAPDPDDDVDNDDNGTSVSGTGIVTGEITLAAETEPINDGDSNANTNFTLDVGVVQAVDVSVTKVIDQDDSNRVAGGEVFFDITFQNLGTSDATGVTVVDTLPAGLTLDQASSDFGGFTPVIVGQEITVNVGSLAAGAAGTIRIAADIDVALVNPVTNTVDVDATEADVDPSNKTATVIVSLLNADLAITKTDDVTGTLVAGDQMTYTITVVNNGPDTATGIVAMDTLPSGLSFVSSSFTSGSGSVTDNSGVLTIDIDDLNGSQSAVVEIVVDSAVDVADTLDNTVTVSMTPDIDPDPTDNTATVQTAVSRDVDASVTKTFTGTPTAGGQLTFVIDVTNDGPSPARGVQVLDTLASEFTFVSLNAGNSGATVSQSGQDLTFDLPEVDVNETLTFEFTVDIAGSASGTINNQADVTTSDNDTDASNDSDDVDVTLAAGVLDLVLTKDVDLATAVPGQDSLVYSFTIAHDTDSNTDAGQVTFTDVLPAGTTGLTITAPDATSTNYDSATRTVTVVYDSVALAVTRSFTVSASINEEATGTLDNTGNIVIDGGDDDASNNTATASTTLTPQFDVTIDKTVDDTTPAPTTDVTYTIEIANTGPSTATTVELSDVIPTGMTFVSAALEGQAGSVSGSDITFAAVSLDSNETQTATIVLTVDANASGTLTNSASVTADSGETDTTNNTDSVSITATPEADLSIAKTVDQASAEAGDTLVYSITVTNAGPSTAVDAISVDTLPAGVTFVSGTGPDGALTESGGTVTVDGGDLDSGSSYNFTITVTVDNTTIGSVTNSVTVSTTTDEDDTSNNTATAVTTVTEASGSISGRVYLDSNDNGIVDDGEVGISGVVVTVTGTRDDGDTVDLSTTTDADGNYVFAELAAGTYDVEQVQPADFIDGQTTAGTGATATVIDNAFIDLDLGIGADAIDFNFGELAAQLSKRRFLASNG